jgi:hypothetical protein
MKRVYWLLILIVLVLYVESSFADLVIPDFVDKVDAKTEANKIASNAANLLYILGGVVGVLGLIIGALKIMDNKAEEGWQAVKNTLIGMAVLVFTGTIVHIFG